MSAYARAYVYAPEKTSLFKEIARIKLSFKNVAIS